MLKKWQLGSSDQKKAAIAEAVSNRTSLGKTTQE